MKAPPFLLGATLLFLGWRSQILVWTLFPAILVELPHFTTSRWEFSLQDLRRVFDLCMVLMLAEGLIIYSSADHLSSELSLKFSQWLPLPLFPILLLQIYGNYEKIPLSVFSFFLRRSPESALAKKSYNITYLYFAICLMAAGAVQKDTPYFYPGVVILIGYALWSVRPRQSNVFAAILWVVLIVIVSGIGFAGQRGLRVAQGNIEEALNSWINLHWRKEMDPRESLTAIGRVGRIHLSGKIVLRLTPEANDSLPALINEASYSIYSNGLWRIDQNLFSSVSTADTNDTIQLLEPKKVHYGVKIAKYLRNGNGLLPLPKGAYEIRNLPGFVNINAVGTARLEDGPNMINCTVLYGPGECVFERTNSWDWDVPPQEAPVLAQIASELKLDDPKKTESQKIQAITHFFKDFNYSLEVAPQAIDPTGQKTALGQFLTTTKVGHCEYFATATVLLLRQAGIAARYATGYAVNESSKSGKTVLVRERHAHAWVLVYRKDFHRWDELDTTGADLNEIEKNQTSFWESVSDAWSNLLYRFNAWRNSKSSFLKYARWLLIPLILIFLWRVLFTKRQKQKMKNSEFIPAIAFPGMDSEFYLIEQRLSAAGMNRMPHELFGDWTSRLSLPEPELLNHIIELHRRLRFDPQGLSAAEREVLKLEVSRWLLSFGIKAASN